MALREYELYVPLVLGGGKRVPKGQIQALKKRLVARFGGLTHFPQHNKGIWRVGDSTFREKIIILRVLAKESRNVRAFWIDLKKRLERQWKQTKILIVTRKVKVV